MSKRRKFGPACTPEDSGPARQPAAWIRQLAGGIGYRCFTWASDVADAPQRQSP